MVADVIVKARGVRFGLTLFTYCAKQSSNYRIEERRNRKIELELASLDPYLKDLEEVQPKEVKQSLVKKYFGVELPITNGKEPPKANDDYTLINNPQLLQTLVEKVSQIKQKENM